MRGATLQTRAPHRPRRVLAAAALTLGFGLTGFLAGCTAAAETDGPEGTTAPTPTSTVVPQAETLKCTDGFQLVDADVLTGTKTTTVSAKCDQTAVVGTGGKLSVKGTATLTVEGTKNSITVDKATTTLRLGGNDNTIVYTGDVAPEVDDQGTGNSVKAAAPK